MDEKKRTRKLSNFVTPVKRSIRRNWLDLKFSAMSQKIFEVRPGQSPTKVIVFGSGLSGLASAHKLELLGHDVTVLEASAQIGGRADTIREMFSDGLYADAGGFRFAGGHYLIRKYIKYLGLSIEPFYPSSGDMLLYLSGQSIRRKSGELIDLKTLPRPLNTEESWMLNQEIDEDMYKICGGVDKFVNALFEKLNCGVQLFSEIKKVIQTDKGVKVEYLKDGEKIVEEADYVVCAIPFCCLKNVEFEPKLSEKKQNVIESLKYRPAMLVYFQMPSEYWIEQNLSGFAVTDTVGEIWTYGLDNRSGTCVTISYTKDGIARELLAMTQEQRVAITTERCGEFLPWFKDFARNGTALSWDEDRYIRGSRSTAMFLKPEQIDEIRRPEKRIHFAGEHAAKYHIGWMEGALESAQRVAEEINGILQ